MAHHQMADNIMIVFGQSSASPLHGAFRVSDPSLQLHVRLPLHVIGVATENLRRQKRSKYPRDYFKFPYQTLASPASTLQKQQQQQFKETCSKEAADNSW
jgi:hypothetical protein